MTDRHAGYLVTLKRPLRSDDAEVLVNAIKLLEPVATVEPLIDNSDRQFAVDKARWEILLDALGGGEKLRQGEG